MIRRFGHERECLLSLSGAQGERLTIPKLLGFDDNPPLLIMSRLGPTLRTILSNTSLNPEQISKIGGAIGEACAELYIMHDGLVQNDLKPDNLTVENLKKGHIGMIDLAMLSKVEPVWNFSILMRMRPNFVPAAVAEFTRLTGIELPPAYIAQCAHEHFAKVKARVPEAKECIDQNLRAWTAQLNCGTGKDVSIKPSP